MNKPGRSLSTLAGYCVDVVRLASGVPINLHSYSKFLVLKRLARLTGADCLIETGTYLGVTAARCASVFRYVFTIELDPELASKAALYLRGHHNVELVQGDAVTVLPELLKRKEARNLLVFLDGHFSGGNTAHGDVPEPALLELKMLSDHSEQICGIVIDDFRLFGLESGFPKKSVLISAVERSFPPSSFTLKIHADQVIVARKKLD